MTTQEIISTLTNEGCLSEHPVVVSDDWCIGVHRVTDIRWNQDKQRIEIVCNNK